jgi:hypothetical protein
MDPTELADEAMAGGDEGLTPAEKKPMGNPEVKAYMAKFLKAIGAKDTDAMAAAFEGAAEAADADAPDAGGMEE